jgi:GntR family transcriptional regulator
MRPSSAHAVIRDALRSEIQEGDLRPGDQLPTEFELVERFGVSRHTVRLALQQLTSEGLIVRRAGHGTFVTSYARDPANAHIIGDDEQMFGLAAGPPLSIVEPLAVVHDAAVAERLDARTDEVARLSFVRATHGRRIGFWLIYLPLEVHDQIAPALRDLQGSSASVIGVLEQVTDRVAQRAEQDMTAEAATADVAEHLGVEPGEPLLRAERTYFDVDDRPLEHVLVRYVPALFSYRLHVLRSRSVSDPHRRGKRLASLGVEPD